MYFGLREKIARRNFADSLFAVPLEPLTPRAFAEVAFPCKIESEHGNRMRAGVCAMLGTGKMTSLHAVEHQLTSFVAIWRFRHSVLHIGCLSVGSLTY